MTELSYEDVLAVVERAAPSDRDAAERVLQAVLQTLGERIAAGEARDLATQLPPELSPWVATTTPPERFDVDEFLRRVAERSGTGLAGAERQTRAVFAALGRVLTPDELADVAAELSKDYAPLLPRGPHVEVLPAEAFVQRVAQRAGVDPPRAERATDAVLETLAERITDGEVDDLVSRLPFALHPPLKRGRAHRTDAAARMPLDAFLRHVAELEDVTPQMARHHASAVLATLREAVGDDEFFDVKSQLPGEYAAVLDAR